MAGGPQARLLDDGRRLHLHHGPIDLIIGAEGEETEIARAYAQAGDRFEDVLDVLVGDLKRLRSAVEEPRWHPRGPVARRMMNAVWPHRAGFVTPMAAVAGAVADEVLAAMIVGRDLAHGWVNNSGDIAFHLVPGQALTLGMVGDLFQPGIDGLARLDDTMNIRGVATSGWEGRSYSLGIADAVTVLACDAATADVAATLIANEVDVADPAIRREPARSLDDDSDLGHLPVTVEVGDLQPAAIAYALDRGAIAAETMRAAGLMEAAVLLLKGETRVVGDAPTGIEA